MRLIPLLVPAAALMTSACGPEIPEPQVSPPITLGAPRAGAAEASLDLPIGTPLGGFSSRCKALGSTSKVDNRDSAYALSFMRSAGVHTRPQVKVVWLEIGGDHLVLIKSDTIYTFDGLVQTIADQLEEATGLDLDGRVVMSSSHTHNGPANYSDQIHFYLGGDKYNPENFQRYAKIATDTALLAYADLRPAAIGQAWQKDWDPNDRVYRDRRGDNDALAVWDDVAPGYDKDPYLHLTRVDDAATGEPIAIVFAFGMHGTLLGEDNWMYSTDSTGGVEAVVQDQLDTPAVVFHLQTGGGDASPAGSDEDFARAETLGEYAVDAIMDLWERTPTSSEPMRLETASRHINEARDEIRVTRDGAVDWTYAPIEFTIDEDGNYDYDDYASDGIIYGDDGEILSPIDDFGTATGAAFCGSETPLVPGAGVGTDVFPYSGCVRVDFLKGFIAGVFELELDTFPLPLPEDLKAGTTAVRMGPLPILMPDGEAVEDDWLVAFFPGETTGMFVEQFRRRAEAELGQTMAMAVGYSQDHEGYLLIPEDWLVGGYEPNINVWGPLQAEHIMEGVLTMADDVLGTTDKREDPDPLGWWAPTTYADKPLPEQSPDLTPSAGTRLTTAPEYLLTPREIPVDLTVPETCPRVQCVVQLAWEGGDPAVDLPQVVLERLDGDTWAPVTTRAGREVSDTFGDILTVHTPDPLYPYEADQAHRWWAGWQAVSHVHDRAGLPLGTYRLTVRGQRYTGGATSWPWPSEAYTLSSEPFEVVPAELSVAVVAEGLQVWLAAPATGWRLVHLDGRSTGDNPIVGPITLTWTLDDGSELDETLDAGETTASRTLLRLSPPEGAVSVRVLDGYQNEGATAL